MILGVLDGVCERLKIDKIIPAYRADLKGLLHGIKGKVVFPYTNQAGRQRTFEVEFDGIIGYLEKRSRETSSDYIQRELDQFRSSRLCSTCHGARLRPEALAVTVGGKNIDAVTRMSISEALEFFQHLDISEREMTIVHQVLKEIRERLRFLENVGLNYLTLNRMAATLSGGEAQRIRLATQIGSSLVGVLYILDEPSIGLHQRDNQKLLDSLKRLRDIGNTVIVVEHDEDTIREAASLVDIGPGRRPWRRVGGGRYP